MPREKKAVLPQITVSGVTFTAEQVKSAVVTIEGRDIFIGEKSTEKSPLGFPVTQPANTQKGK